MNIFNALSLIGGLALFLFGMETLGSGLTTLSGGRMEAILEKLTSNVLKSVLVGALVTAIIQSSSTTTVMVVALVNAGVMQLNQAVGVIMGANIGTTITSWLLSLSGIESDNLFIQLLKPSSFTPVLAIIAVILLMSSKRDSRRSIATIMIGFAVLMYGMDAMTAAVVPLRELPAFTELFALFAHPIVGLLVGALLTAIIQSSSASVGILQALCATGAVTYSAAIPIIMGQNIGTCVTALLASIGTSKNAKRTAYIHLSFNLIGTTLFMLLFYSINWVRPFAFLENAVRPFDIAIIHSVFNILATLVLLPFAGQLVRLVQFVIRDKADDISMLLDPVDEDLKRLDPHFLEKPGFAVEQAHATMTSMARQAYRAVENALLLLDTYSDERFDLVCRMEQQIDRYEDALNAYLMQISGCQLNDRDNRNLTIMIHSLNDFERISDHAINIGEQAQKKANADQPFSAAAMDDVHLYSRALLDILDRAVTVFAQNDVDYARTIEPLEQRIDDLDTEFNNRHVARLRKGTCTGELGVIINELYANMERVADHCSNIGICTIQYNAHKYTSHEYTTDLNKTQGKFAEYYQAFAEQYQLPAQIAATAQRPEPKSASAEA